MEILVIQLETLLSGFITDFVQPILESDEYQTNGELPRAVVSEYWNYLKAFKALKTKIETYPSNTREDQSRKYQALTLLNQSSNAIFETFALNRS